MKTFDEGNIKQNHCPCEEGGNDSAGDASMATRPCLSGSKRQKLSTKASEADGLQMCRAIIVRSRAGERQVAARWAHQGYFRTSPDIAEPWRTPTKNRMISLLH